MIVSAVLHSSRVNWGQALATGATVLGGLVGLAAYVNNRVENYRARSATALSRAIHEVTDVLAGRLDTVDQHLADQDRRLWRIEDTAIKTKHERGTE